MLPVLAPRANLLDFIAARKSVALASFDDLELSDERVVIPPTNGTYLRLKTRLEDPEEVTEMRILSNTAGVLLFPHTLRVLELHEYSGTFPDFGELPGLATFFARLTPRLSTLPRGVSTLTTLVLRATPQLTSRTVRNFLSENFGLVHVDLGYNPQFSDAEISAGLAELKRLEFFASDLEISAPVPGSKKPKADASVESPPSPGLGPLTLKTLTKNAEFLREISMNGCGGVEAAAVSGLLLKCRHLQVASFSECLRLDTEIEAFEAAFGKIFRSPHEPPVTLKLATFVGKQKISGVDVQTTRCVPEKPTPLLGPPPVQDDPKKNKKKKK